MCRPPTAWTVSGCAFLAVLPQGADEDAGGVQLVAAQFGHQPPPVRSHNRQRHSSSMAERGGRWPSVDRLVAEVRRVERLVRVPGLPLGDLLLPTARSSAGSFSFASFFSKLLQSCRRSCRSTCLAVERDFAARQRLLPTVAAWQVAAVPLGANVVDLAQQAPVNQIHGVVVQHAVVPLVAGRQVAGPVSSAKRPMTLHWATLWAISFSVSTCLPAFIASRPPERAGAAAGR